MGLVITSGGRDPLHAGRPSEDPEPLGTGKEFLFISVAPDCVASVSVDDVNLEQGSALARDQHH
jgi:hypothetical protein